MWTPIYGMAVDLKKILKKPVKWQQATAVDFAQLLHKVANAHPNMRVRFSTSNPQDISDDVLHAMAAHRNICDYIHLPVQSGSDRILKEMNRLHTRQEYMD